VISQTVFRSEQWVAANDDLAGSKIELGIVVLVLAAVLSLVATVLYPEYMGLLGLLF
jgi:hypothetical protein